MDDIQSQAKNGARDEISEDFAQDRGVQMPVALKGWFSLKNALKVQCALAAASHNECHVVGLLGVTEALHFLNDAGQHFFSAFAAQIL